MDSTRVPPIRIRAAIAISLVLHLCAAALLALRSAGPSPTVSPILDPVDARYTVTRIVRRTPVPRPARTARPPVAVLVSAARGPAPAARRSTPAPVPATTARIASSARARPTALGSRPASSPVGDSAVPAQIAIVQRPPQAAPPTPTPTPTPSPLPTPAPNPTPSVTDHPAANFSGLFSQNYAPALPTPAIVTTIRSRLGGHGRIRIDVDEAGHATSVAFTGRASDAVSPDVQDVRDLLFAQTYVPADCNGLHCAGTLELTY